MDKKSKEVPYVVKDDYLNLGNLKIRVCVLNDGRRIIPEDEMCKALSFLGISKEEFALLRFDLLRKEEHP